MLNFIKAIYSTITPIPCPFSVLAIALLIYYSSIPTGTEEVK